MGNDNTRIQIRMTARALAGACVVMALLIGCGSTATQEPQAPPSDKALSTVDEASAAFDAAEDELASMIVSGDADAGHQTVQPGYSQPPGDDPAASEMARSTRLERRQRRCTRACKALASMQRSADRLCSMTGASDSRCKSVQERVRAARRLVQRACPSCSA